MTGFVKIFSSILDSSVWGEPMHVRIVWIALLAMADRTGKVDASVSGVTRRAGVTREECESALAILQEPDPDSRTPDFDGRRLQKVEGGWKILNYKKYRELGHQESEKARKREWWSDHKAESASCASPSSSASERESARGCASPLLLPLPSVSEGGECERGEALVPCPKDLDLDQDQRATLEIHVPCWAIDALRAKFVAKALSSKKDLRTREHWVKCLVTAITGDWNDPNKRPRQATETTSTSDQLGGRGID